MSDPADGLIVGLVVAGRLGLPLLIFRFPLPGILACLVLDGFDQTIFQQFTSFDLDGYQGYDKALDVYYLSLAYVATMRNWVSGKAFSVARFLFYYRLVGVAAFELTDGEHSALLLVFPNTFEFFFIFYELLRTRWNPKQWSARLWVLSAAAIWIFIKLPQEYWIHVANLDVTDIVGDHPWLGAAAAVAVAGLAAALRFVVQMRMPVADHPVVIEAGPLPATLSYLDQRLAYRVGRGGVFDLWLLEKVVLISFVCVIFVQMLPGAEASPLQITLSVAGLVAVNSLLSLVTARRGRGFDSGAISFIALAAVNAGIVLILRDLRQVDNVVPAVIALFFVLLLTLIVTLYDRYRPVLDVRMGFGKPPPGIRE